MAGAAQQGGSRRAWGAPAHPKPAAEQRRDLEAAVSRAAAAVPERDLWLGSPGSVHILTC